MGSTDIISRIALDMGKTKQDLANWRYHGKVPATLQFDIYLEAAKYGVELTKDDFKKFGVKND